jgi:hypothetical protein
VPRVSSPRLFCVAALTFSDVIREKEKEINMVISSDPSPPGMAFDRLTDMVPTIMTHAGNEPRWNDYCMAYLCHALTGRRDQK